MRQTKGNVFMFNRSFGCLNTLRRAVMSLLVLLTATGTSADTCTLKSNDREWIERTLDLWQTVSRDSLRLKPVPLPWIVLFDQTCVWHINPDLSIATPNLLADSVKVKLSVARKSLDVYGILHKGEITLPNKEHIPPQLVSFASTYKNG